MNKTIKIMISALALFILQGCVTDYRNQAVYNKNEALRAASYEVGTVVGSRNIMVAPSSSRGFAGATIGAAIAVGAAETINNHKTRRVARIVGTVIGGAAGSKIENRVNTIPGVELMVKRDNGTHISVVQEINRYEAQPEVGDVVRIIKSGGKIRVTRY